ncbi:hypothetical protein OOT55_13870 [Marinimicrobium sp. C6131]|uniref:hypothetical protein n=1 Tax=Marinimicrobium sp. C6131 TaxID=3022676 RepID=UPI00223DAD6D|nr:hypothetical protein [Marinimicrobium sp. C6131]UZJ43735.1 hypothetical protein OOT55_13870 [Marinimicrobium sp. C6131]
MVHFTYSESVDKSCLKQGDVLSKTPALDSLLNQVHPHYSNSENYTHFQVLTQSCDLVKRNGNKCSSNYITLAAVRPLSDVLSRELGKNSVTKFQGDSFCSESKRQKITDFLRVLMNNNHKDYFFLKSDQKMKLYEDSCTFLHLSIAIRANEHYEKCLDAKTVQLEPTFRSKLGWLVGNLYSRVGTPDWAPDNYSQQDFNNYIKNVLDENVIWIPKNIYNDFKKEIREREGEGIESIITDLERRQDSNIEKSAYNLARFLVEDSGLKIEGEELQALARSLKNKSGQTRLRKFLG